MNDQWRNCEIFCVHFLAKILKFAFQKCFIKHPRELCEYQRYTQNHKHPPMSCSYILASSHVFRDENYVNSNLQKKICSIKTMLTRFETMQKICDNGGKLNIIGYHVSLLLLYGYRPSFLISKNDAWLPLYVEILIRTYQYRTTKFNNQYKEKIWINFSVFFFEKLSERAVARRNIPW